MISHTYYLGVGSNLNREHNINACLHHLRCSFAGMVVSPVYQSPAFGFTGHDFHNLVVRINSAFAPDALKRWLQRLEDAHGRDRKQPRYSDRTLDVDLLLCDDMIINDGFVQIPRDEILKRAYVLKPLQDIAPELIHPLAQKRLADLWQAFVRLNEIELQEITYQQCHRR
jgi:2-amino-4-hydroxy-6-hydroxymethyldihydropteridine diphosphokinase